MKKNYNKITTKLGLLLLIVAICVGTNAFAQTTIWSSGFEAADPAFTYNATTGTAVNSTTTPRTGTNSGRVGLNGFDASIITPLMTFYPGYTYSISVYARTTTCTRKLQIMKSTTATNAAMLAATGNDIILSSATNNVTSTTYAQFTATFTVSATESKYIGFQMQSATVGGCGTAAVNIDDVVLSVTCPTAPVIASTGLCSGTATTLTLTTLQGVTGVQWQSSTDNSSFTNISGATSLTYTTPNLTATTYYRANYTWPCGAATSSSSTVAIIGAPTFTLQPTSATQCRGTSTVLSASASPSSSTYQWQYWNGSSWANVANGTPANFTYTNATTANLTVTTTTSATAGAYQFRCNATACSGSTSSSTATLTVNAAPTPGTIAPLSTSGACGSIPAVSLTLTGGTGTIQWQSSSDATNWYDILNETSSTYASNVSSTSYFRAVRTLNGCTSVQASNAVVNVTGATSATYTGANGGAWTTAGNWSTGVVPTACTDVTIPAGKSVAVAAATISTTVCHNLTVAAGGTVTVNFPSTSNGNYLFVTGNLDNDGTITQSQQSTAQTAGAATGQCNKCGGVSLTGQGVTWDGDGTYPILTITIEDNSDITMVHDASIDFLNCTKTAIVGKLNLGSKTLQLTNVFAQAGSEVHLNTGMLWLQLQASMLVDINTLYPEYGIYFNDLTGSWGIGGAWNNIGGMGFYDLWERSNGTATNFIRNSCNHLARKDFRIWSGVGHIEGDPTTPYTTEVRGDFINEDNDGTPFDANVTTVLMQGPALIYNASSNTYTSSTAIQNITGPATTAFHNLTINNATNGVKLNGVNASTGLTTTTGVLTLTNGPYYLNSQTHTVVNNNASAVVRTNGCVVSETNSAVNPSILTWNMGTTTGAHVVPFGTATGASNYIPFTFNKTTAGSANISFSTRATAASDNLPWAGVSSVAAVNTMASYNAVTATYYADATLPSVIDRWWDITTSAAVTANLTFSYKGSENTTTDNPTGEMKAQHWNGSYWDAPVGTGTGVTSGIGTVTAAGQSTFSPWVISSLMIPLPVELEKFKVDCDGNEAVFNWSTVREQNNNYFTIEKSLDGINFYEVGRTYSTAKGLSSSNIEYSFKDANPTNAYYRLSQTDFSNKHQVLKMIHLNKCTTRKQYMNAYSVNDAIVIQADFDMQDEVEATVMNALGQIVGKRTLNLTEGFNEFKMENLGVNTGIYYLTISGKSIDTFSKKLLLAK